MPSKREILGEDTWALLIMDACGKVHLDAGFKACMHASLVLCWYGEPNLTDSYQPVDASYGKLCRELALCPVFGLEHWLWLKKRNRRMWA